MEALRSKLEFFFSGWFDPILKGWSPFQYLTLQCTITDNSKYCWWLPITLSIYVAGWFCQMDCMTQHVSRSPALFSTPRIGHISWANFQYKVDGPNYCLQYLKHFSFMLAIISKQAQQPHPDISLSLLTQHREMKFDQLFGFRIKWTCFCFKHQSIYILILYRYEH